MKKSVSNILAVAALSIASLASLNALAGQSICRPVSEQEASTLANTGKGDQLFQNQQGHIIFCSKSNVRIQKSNAVSASPDPCQGSGNPSCYVAPPWEQVPPSRNADH